MINRTTIDEASFRAMWADGVSRRAMAEALGCGIGTIRNRANEWQLPPRAKVKRCPRAVPVVQPKTAPKPPPVPVAAPPEAVALFRRLGGGERAVSVVAGRYGLSYEAVRAMA